MRIAIDAMGGDYGPEVVIPGAFTGARDHGVGLILVGRPETIRPIIAKTDTAGVALAMRTSTGSSCSAAAQAASVIKVKQEIIEV